MKSLGYIVRPFVCTCEIQALLLLVFFSSCIKEECPETDKNMQTIHILPVWENKDSLPTGIRVYFFSKETNKSFQDNFPSSGGITTIRNGTYSLLMYNNDSEKILFRNTLLRDSFEAYTREQVRSSFINPVPEEKTYEEPDNLWISYLDSVEISSSTKEIRLYPVQTVHRYTGHIKTDQVDKIQAARGAISGITTSLLLRKQSTGKEPGTLLFDAVKTADGISFTFSSFGPYPRNGSQPRKHYLSLEFLLANGIYRHNFEITNPLDSIPGGGVLPVNYIVLPPDTTAGNGGSFDGNVDNWVNIFFPIPI